MFVRFCLVTVLAVVSLPLCAAGKPAARGGVIDFSLCPLANGDTLSLDGEWEFYPGLFLDPSSDPPSSAVRVTAGLPGLWEDGKAPGGVRFGTYRLRVMMPPSKADLYLHVPYMYSSYRLFVNGRLAALNGEPGTTQETTRPFFHPETAAIRTDVPVLDIRIHIANFHDRKGGIWETPRISVDDSLLREHTRRTSAESFMLGMLFIFGLYHICMHFFRRDERTALWFGLFCLAVGVRSLFVGTMPVYSFFPSLPWSAACRIEYVSCFLMPLFFILYSIELFPGEFSRMAGKACIALACAASAVVLATDKAFFGVLIHLIQAFTVSGTAYILYGYVRAALRRRPGAVIALGGFLFFLVAVVNDLLFGAELIRSANLLQYGFMFFVFAHSVNLSYIFAQAFRKVKTLSKQLEQANNELEEKVGARTFELSEKNRLLELARGEAEKDLLMAVKVQMSVMPRTAPAVEGWDIGFSLVPMAGVSGDFYDFYSTDEGLKGAAIFDVSGHGISSGFVTMLAKWIIFKTFMQNLDKPLSSVFELLGHMLPEAIGSTQYFLTGNILRFSGDTVEYANAGHPDLLRLTPSGLEAVKGRDGRKVKGRLLGCRGITSEYETVSMRVEKGECLILMTDGLLETENRVREQFGFTRLEKALAPVGKMGAQEMCDYIVSQAAAFRDGAPQSDDISLIVIRRR